MPSQRVGYTWWVWLITACQLLIGLIRMPGAFLAAVLLSIAQSVFGLADLYKLPVPGA